MCKAVRQPFSVQARHCGISLSVNFASSPQSIIARLDEIKFSQVITNLIGNAMKFTHSGGSVTVSVTHLEAQGTVRINVTDTGVGIAQV